MAKYVLKKEKLKIDERLIGMRKEYKSNGIPTILDESLNLLLLEVAIKNPARILEIGTATGMSGICMLQQCKNATLTTVECDADSFAKAKKNFAEFGVANRVSAYYGDAGEVIRCLDGGFDFIFLDGAKARYYDYLPDIERLLKVDGVLFADNVLFRGLIESERPPHRDMTIVRNMRCFIDYLVSHEDYVTSVFDIGDGVLIAHKNR